MCVVSVAVSGMLLSHMADMYKYGMLLVSLRTSLLSHSIDHTLDNMTIHCV